MSEYTPNTDEVFQGFYQTQVPVNGLYGTRLRSCVHYQIKHEITRAEFDRWLASVKAEAWDEGFDAGVDNAVLKEFVFNPYTIKSERAQQYIQDKLRDDKRGQTKTKARE